MPKFNTLSIDRVMLAEEETDFHQFINVVAFSFFIIREILISIEAIEYRTFVGAEFIMV